MGRSTSVAGKIDGSNADVRPNNEPLHGFDDRLKGKEMRAPGLCGEQNLSSGDQNVHADNQAGKQ